MNNSILKSQSKGKHVKRSNDCNDNNDTKYTELILMKPLEGANNWSRESASTKSRLTNQLSEKLFGNEFDYGT